MARSTPAPSAGHQAVEVRAADQGEPRAECDRGDDVGAGHDAGVEVDLDVPADLADHVGEQVERDRRPVELAAAVVRQRRSPSTPSVGQPAGVLDGLDALDDDLARPVVPDPGQVLEGRRSGRTSCRSARRPCPTRVESDANASGSVVRKLNHHAGRGTRRARSPRVSGGGIGEAVALVAQPGARHRDVDGDQQRVEPGLRRPLDQLHRPVPVLPHVQLEPVAAVGFAAAATSSIDRRAHRGQRERDPGPPGGPGARRARPRSASSG